MADPNVVVSHSTMKVSPALLQRNTWPGDMSCICIRIAYAGHWLSHALTGALHSIGECRHVMRSYLACMKKVRGINEDECRGLAKSYLACRMDR